MDETCDAIVVGAGPAGAALATLLSREGWRTTLVDAARFPRPKVCGECLSISALPVLQELGIEAAVREVAVLQRRLRIVAPRGACLELALGEHTNESVLGISRSHLDWLLLEQARAAGVRLLLEHRVRRVHIEERRCVGLEVLNGGEGERAEPLVLKGRVVIAADGRFSTVVRASGTIFTRGPRQVAFKRHRVSPPGTLQPEDEITMISLRGGYVGVCNVEGGQQNICGLIPRDAVRQARGSIDAGLTKLLQDYDRDLCSIQATQKEDRWLTLPDVRQQWAEPQIDSVVYVGDALATVEPLAGQGLAMALGGARLAADLLLADRRAPINAAWQRRYALNWRRRFGPNVQRAQWLGWLLRRPALLYPLARLAPTSRTLEDLLLRATYRSTRLQAGDT